MIPRIFRASGKLERLIVKKTTIENPISTQRSTPAANANAFLQTALSDLLRSQGHRYIAHSCLRSSSDRVLTFYVHMTEHISKQRRTCRRQTRLTLSATGKNCGSARNSSLDR